MTPLDAALAIWRTAAASSCLVLATSPEAAASRNLRTLVRSVESTCALRMRCFCAWRFCFSAERVLANGDARKKNDFLSAEEPSRIAPGTCTVNAGRRWGNLPRDTGFPLQHSTRAVIGREGSPRGATFLSR